MSLTMKVTERDKKLLVLLGGFLLIAGFVWFLIRPALSDASDIADKTIQAQTQERKTRYDIGNIGEYEEKLAASSDELAQQTEDFYPLMQAQQIDSLLTLKALENGFAQSDLRELSITAPQSELQLAAYQSETKTTEDDALAGIYGADASFTLYGQRDALERFIDTLVRDSGSMRITKLDWKDNTNTDGACLVTIGLQILMSDSADHISAAQELINNAK